MTIKDVLVSASVAVGNVASRERDRDVGLTYEDGRPRPMAERAEGRVKALATEGVAKVAVSQGAHIGVRELAKRVNQETLKKLLGQLSKSPAASAGTALFAFDMARDGLRFARGRIDGGELAERVGGNAAGLAGAGAGAYVGSFVGTLAMPVIGTAVGSVVGGVIGGIGGDTYGRRKIRDVLGMEEDGDDFDDDDFDDDYDG